jgi:hypothetical protein
MGVRNTNDSGTERMAAKPFAGEHNATDGKYFDTQRSCKGRRMANAPASANSHVVPDSSLKRQSLD